MAAERFAVLDGWRAVSILLVLAAHLLPLGPNPLHLNVAAGLLGMGLFFTLSGFLITHFLLGSTNIVDFMIRRFARILPLIWLYMAVVFAIHPVTGEVWMAHFLFYANYPPKPLIPVTDHLWSLCVEMHFYIGIALLVILFRKKGLLLLPAICIGFTLLRVVNGVHFSVITHYRIDDILAGAVLALIYHDRLGSALRMLVTRTNPGLVLLLLLISSHPDSGFMQYLRPYFCAALVGITLFNDKTVPVLNHHLMAYIGAISFALYVIHPLLASTWLGSGEDWEKYAKRPLLFLVLLVCAHASTFYYERRWIEFGRRLSCKMKNRRSLWV
ncbi:hypothetical protein MTYP_01635 [Methylophilaceae bacterium]|nr:hypothetical protein MTYP_01635 [Methylophilaceae bacterium]